MQAGALDRRITIQSFTETQDSFRQPVKTWADLATVWAQVLPLRGVERFQAQQEDAREDTKFRIRYRADVSVEHRISYGGALYDITAVLELGRREGLEILATAKKD